MKKSMNIMKKKTSRKYRTSTIKEEFKKKIRHENGNNLLATDVNKCVEHLNSLCFEEDFLKRKSFNT